MCTYIHTCAEKQNVVRIIFRHLDCNPARTLKQHIARNRKLKQPTMATLCGFRLLNVAIDLNLENQVNISSSHINYLDLAIHGSR